jgi:NADH-quinone oxidoreductase subunit G
MADEEVSDETHAKKTLVIVGQGALRRPDGAAVLSQAMRMAERSNSGLLVLHTAAGRVGAMDAGAVTEGGVDAALNGAEVVYALGVDEMDIPAGPTVIYQGSHGDRGAHRADIILPAAAWTEEQGLFVNTEGRPQLALRAGFPPGDAKENWAILRALSPRLGHQLPYDTLAALRRGLVAEVPHLARIDTVPDNDRAPLPVATPDSAPFVYAVGDHYLSNAIARASALMAELSAAARARSEQPIAAE